MSKTFSGRTEEAAAAHLPSLGRSVFGHNPGTALSEQANELIPAGNLRQLCFPIMPRFFPTIPNIWGIERWGVCIRLNVSSARSAAHGSCFAEGALPEWTVVVSRPAVSNARDVAARWLALSIPATKRC
jgi:hypothetical protein